MSKNGDKAHRAVPDKTLRVQIALVGDLKDQFLHRVEVEGDTQANWVRRAIICALHGRAMLAPVEVAERSST
jgi:hypothetical protein